MTVLNTAIDEFQAAVLIAINRDRVKVVQKNILRDSLIDLLHKLGYYVLFAAQGNRVVALESGFTIAKEPSPVLIDQPTGLKAEYTTQSGELVMSVKRVKGAAAYLYQYTTDPTLKEDSWMSLNCTQARCKLEGLTPGTTYYLRVGALGTKDQVLYSTVTSKLAA